MELLEFAEDLGLKNLWEDNNEEQNLKGRDKFLA